MLKTIALKVLLEICLLKDGETSTVSLAEKIGVSQQSVSRVVAELAKGAMIGKQPFAGGLRLSLTEKGRNRLLALEAEIGRGLRRKAKATLQGNVEHGIGEGRYYVSMEHYKSRIMTLLGAEPFPGTFNLKVDPDEKERFLRGLPRTEIPGFVDRERTYGAIDYYHVMVGTSRCGLIIPQRTSHPKEKIELVASFSLRRALRAEDGDVVVVETPAGEKG